MDDTEYYKDAATRVKELMEDTFGGYFKEYFNGEPENISENQLPCVMIITNQMAVQFGAAGTDNIVEEITIIMALNKMDDVGATSKDDLTLHKLRRLIIGQDPVNGQDALAPYMQNSVMNAIRQHITLEGGATDNRVDINFDVNVRGQNVATQEAYITLRINRQALVLSRN